MFRDQSLIRARKLELALDERTGEFDGDASAMKMLTQDALRLAEIVGG